MVNQDLADYIRQARRMGKKDVEIKSKLIARGFEESDIEETLLAVDALPVSYSDVLYKMPDSKPPQTAELRDFPVKPFFSLQRAAKIIFLLSLVLFAVSYFKKNDLPPEGEILPSLQNEPIQQEAGLQPFDLSKGDYIYRITPYFGYELYGLVVADYNSENWLDFMHKNDPLNSKDVCVLWGDDVKDGIYNNVKFSHGEFTCFLKSKSGTDSSWYSRFSMSQISNNHFLPANDDIYKKVIAAKPGDQIYFKGYLADYEVRSSSGELLGTRHTSTTREDNGNGACEVVYVTDFNIIKEGNSFFVLVNRLCGYLIIVCLLFFVWNFLKVIFFPQKNF